MIGREGLEVPERVDVPLVMKRRRGLVEERRSGMKVEVRIWVPVTLTSHVWFQGWRIVSRPEVRR